MAEIKPQVIFACGISGAGKSYLLRRYAEARRHCAVVSAGGLIAQARAARDRDILRVLPKIDLDLSQQMLLEGFRELLPTITASVLIIDGHVLMDINEEYPYLVPLEVFESLAPDGFLHIESSPEDIFDRRQSDLSRVRPIRSIEVLSRHQRLSAARTVEIAKTLGIPAATCVSANDEQLSAAIIGLVDEAQKGLPLSDLKL